MKVGPSGTCSVDVALDVIRGRWKPAVMWHLLSGTRRFGELRRLVPGISERMLARQLRQCERDGIVERSVYPEVPPKVEYTLTERGRSLAAILQQLGEWAERDVPPHRLSLSVLPGRYSVCRLDAATSVPPWATQGLFFSVTGTAEELSVACETAAVPPGIQATNDWRALAVQGPPSALGVSAPLRSPSPSIRMDVHAAGLGAPAGQTTEFDRRIRLRVRTSETVYLGPRP